MYNIKVMQRFKSPRNAGTIKKADAVGEVSNEIVGEVVKIYFRVNPETQIIEDASFKTLGSPAVIACSDVACEIAKDKHIEDVVASVSSEEILTYLGELPQDKMSSILTVQNAIKEAVRIYLKKLK